MDSFEIAVDFNGIALFDPDRLEAYYGGHIAEGSNLWERFTTTDDGDRVVQQGIVVPIIGINDGGYQVIVRSSTQPSTLVDPVIVENGVFPLQVKRRAVLADMAVLMDWEHGLGWRDLMVAPGLYGVTIRGFRSIQGGRVVRCGYEFVLTHVDVLPDMTASLEQDMQVLTLDDVA